MLALLLLLSSGPILLTAAESATYLGSIYPVPATLPTPRAFFPLTEGFGESVSAWPDAQLNGYLSSSSPQANWWATDGLFGTSLSCNKSDSAAVILPPMDFANKGPFSISLWFKPDVADLTGQFFQYLYSQTAYGLNNTQPAFAPNSINIYLPASLHPAFGLVRSIVKDGQDQNVTTYLDSDGSISSNAVRTLNGSTLVTDGQWHSVVVTTRPDNASGFLIYIDGKLAAGNATMDDAGGPFNLTGDVVLCSRDSLSVDGRYYSGSLAHLSVFDTALTGDQVYSLYQSVASLTRPFDDPPATASTSNSSTSSTWLNQFNNASNLEVVDGDVRLCSTAESSSSYCSTGYTCAALTSRQLSLVGNAYAGQNVGVCSLANNQGFRAAGIPTPAFYFPMKAFSAKSWPVPEFSLSNNTAGVNVSWASDPLFGSVISCPGDAAMQFQPPAWGQNGSWAFNVWVQQAADAGELFQYLVSARDSSNGAISNTSDVYQANDLHIYLPDKAHPAHGLVRVIAKDNTDIYRSERDQTYLDSDGVVGMSTARNTPRLKLTDGSWHMVTVTTMPYGGKGFQIFVDGMYMAALTDPQPFYSVSAGQGFSIDGPIVLCGRSDLASGRFFEGKIAHFTVFDSPLTNATISQLYGQILSNISETTMAASSIGRQSSNLNQSSAPDALFTVPIGSSGIGLQDDSGGVYAAPLGGALVGELAGGQQQQTLGAQVELQQHKHELSKGAIAGIVLGSVFGAGLLAALIVVVALKVRRRRRMSGVSRLQEVSLPDLMPDSSHSVKLSNGKTLQDKFLVELVTKTNTEEQGLQELKISTKVHDNEPDLL